MEDQKLSQPACGLSACGLWAALSFVRLMEVASASFPLFSRNLKTGGHNEKDSDYLTAKQTVYHSAKYPSHVLLPVIPNTEEAATAAAQ